LIMTRRSVVTSFLAVRAAATRDPIVPEHKRRAGELAAVPQACGKRNGQAFPQAAARNEALMGYPDEVGRIYRGKG
jgi:hypothetical protein